MPIACLTLEIRIPLARSLKDRRQVVRSVKERLRNRFNVSVSELDAAVLWQSATLGVAAISASRDYLRGEMEQVLKAVEEMAQDLGAEIADAFWDYQEP